MKSYFHRAALAALLCSASAPAAERPPRNVILFLGDGMSIATITAARIHAGQLAGGTGEEHVLSFEQFPNVALVKTYNVDRQVPDSAGTMSSIVTGLPHRSGVLSVDPSVPHDDCAGALQHPAPTLLERAEDAGYRTGIVTTTRITHATPASLYAHAPNRGWERDGLMPEAAREAGCRDIARQFAEFAHGDGIEVALGGGRREFLPVSEADPEYPEQSGLRSDGRNLVEEWRSADAARRYVWNAQQLQALPVDGQGAVLGLFEYDHMQYEHERRAGGGNEPSLADMTAFAIRHLAAGDGPGFFLMVEGGRIDHAHHENYAARALLETLMLDAAVARALALTDPAQTLILVTADHAHTLTLSGYPPRGNPILGTVDPEMSEDAPELYRLPFTTLSYANGPGYRSETPDLSAQDTTGIDYQQFAGWPSEYERHSGEDVAAYAHGPGAERLRGVIEQHRLNAVLSRALFGEEQN